MKRSSLVLVTLVCCAGIAAAQQQRPGTVPRKPGVAQATSSQPKFKAIWEPVNYKEDLALTDVFFASADVGWVTGEHGQPGWRVRGQCSAGAPDSRYLAE